MDCEFEFSKDEIKACYIFDEQEQSKIRNYQKRKEFDKKAKLKAFSSYYKAGTEMTDFQADIERILDLSKIKLNVKCAVEKRDPERRKGYLSNSTFINLYTFASVL